MTAVEETVATETAAETVPARQFDAETEEAAQKFTELAPLVKARIKHMASKNGKGLARVTMAAVEFPYATSYPKFRSVDEQTLFMMMLQLNGLKAAVAKGMEADMADIQQEIVDKTTSEIVEKTSEVIKTATEEATNV
jgi:hypothetical protein